MLLVDCLVHLSQYLLRMYVYIYILFFFEFSYQQILINAQCSQMSQKGKVSQDSFYFTPFIQGFAIFYHCQETMLCIKNFSKPTLKFGKYCVKIQTDLTMHQSLINYTQIRQNTYWATIFFVTFIILFYQQVLLLRISYQWEKQSMTTSY